VTEFGGAKPLVMKAADPHEDAVVERLIELWAQTTGGSDEEREERFFSEQIAALRASAPDYYKALYRADPLLMDLHNHHLADTLDNLLRYLERRGEDGEEGKVVVWGHAPHAGATAAFALGADSAWGLGLLAKQRHGNKARVVGMTTYQGTVAASSGWNAPVERIRIEPGPPESYESLFHNVGEPAFLLMLGESHAAAMEIETPRFHREIGAIYKPAQHGTSELTFSSLAEQFDILIHLDETTALEPLDRSRGWEAPARMRTYPTGAQSL